MRAALTSQIDGENQDAKPEVIPKKSDDEKIEKVEKLTFCDVCFLLIEREIEMYNANEQMK